MVKSTIRLRALPSYPLFILLHTLFILLSIILRISELFSPSLSSRREGIRPPRHVALSFQSSSHLSRSSRSSRTKESNVLLESVRRVVSFCAEEGVGELSIWDNGGILGLCQDDLLRDLLELPMSPPSSGPNSPPRRSSMPTDNSVDEYQSTKSSTEGVKTITTFISHDTQPPRPLTIHLIPPSTSSIISSLTRSYVTSKVPVDEISVSTLDEAIQRELHFTDNPELLFIHPLTPPSFFKSLLPRRAPELGGYPFWPLRITEIYQHPTPLPPILPQPLLTLLRRAQTSSLPLLRKLARSFPMNDLGVREGWEKDVKGAFGRETWEGGMRAWEGVEQRLGR